MGTVQVFRRVRTIAVLAVLNGTLIAPSHAESKPSPKAAPKTSPSQQPSATVVRSGFPAPAPETNPTRSAPAPSQTLLDTALVRRLYLDGDFDEAIDKLETSLRYGKGHSHADSVFAFKHLGVMHAAKYETRETGKRYMYQLLAVEPTARILDMYASDMIYMIFKNIKDEFDAGRGHYDRGNDLLADGARRDSASRGSGDTQPRTKRSGAGKYWAGAAAVMAVGAGAFAWYHLSEAAEPKTRHRNIE